MSAIETAPLGMIATIERSIVQPDAIQAGATYIGLEDIEGESGILHPRSVGSGTLASSKFSFTERHVLYGKLRPYLAKIACPEFGGICSTDILPILPGPRVDRRYLFHFLRQPSMVDQASSHAVGVNLPRLNPSVLEHFKIPLPSLPEQRRIAEILDRADALRAKRRAALAQLASLTQSVFLEMFGDPLTNPKGWKRDVLGAVIANGPQNGLYKPGSDYGSGTPIVRIDAFYDGVVTGLGSLKRVRVSERERELYALHPGDLVVNRVNSIEYLGKSALIPHLDEPTVFESNMMRLALDQARIDPVYLVCFLQSAFIKRQIAVAAKNAVNQASINQQDVTAFQVNTPPLPLQREFARRVAAIEKLKAHHRASLCKLDALFASLQHRAFNGEL